MNDVICASLKARVRPSSGARVRSAVVNRRPRWLGKVATFSIVFGKHPADLRRGRGWSQEDLSESGLSRRYIGDVERGRRKIGLCNLGHLADALGIPLGKLMSID
jgi:ribosomal protein L13E